MGLKAKVDRIIAYNGVHYGLVEHKDAPEMPQELLENLIKVGYIEAPKKEVKKNVPITTD